MKKFLSLILVICMVTSVTILTGCSNDADSGKSDKIVLQYAHPVAEDSNTHRLGLKFKEEVERLSDGAIEIQVIPNYSNETALIESLQAGDIAFTLTSAAPTVNFQPKMAVFDVPFLFKSCATPEETMENVYKVFDTEAVKSTLSYLEEANIKGLGYLGLGFRVMVTKKEIGSLADMKGLKIRTMENANHIAAWKALGANPTPMAYSEVFTAIEQNTIDGQEQPFDIIASGKYYEILDYATTLDMIFNTTIFMMSQPIYKDLTAEQQAIIDEAAQLAIEWAKKDAISDVANNMKILTDNNMKIEGLSDAEKAKAVELTADVEKDIRASIGDEIVDVFKKAVDETY
ncbi:MAG: TRAP transporter substrate-binding protein [Firmicutes bacterium]|nr:TRAP transporter substrate-binding protein [Bacillota bacterium]